MLCNGPHTALKVPLLVGASASPSNTRSAGSRRLSIPNGILIGSAVYAQLKSEDPYTLQWAALFPLKAFPSHLAMWTPYNTWFLEPTRVHNPNGISIGSAIFAGLTTVTDRQTDLQTPLLGR